MIDTPGSSAAAISAAVRSGQRSAVSVVDGAIAAIEARDPELHAFLHVAAERARSVASGVDHLIASGHDPGPLAGVPVALKDNVCTSSMPTTCASKILSGWMPPYDATVVTRLEAAGAVVVGKTNLDEFAMGSSTENSCAGPTHHPSDPTRVPGGSSGGSAAAVAAELVPLALGSDTGGSVRQPAALCGVVGLKPTYGRVSRYGLIAFASSLDQIGPLARTVGDAASLFEVIAGHDPMDSTSLDRPVPRLRGALDRGVSGVRVGVCSELVDGVAPDVAARVHHAAEGLAAAGAVVEEISIPEIRFGLSAYYLIAPAEASSNLARYDGVRFGLRVEGADVEQMNIATRTAGFGAEVKRRVMLGTYALSAGYYDAYYAKAQRARTLLIAAFARAYERSDVLVGATAPSTAFALGERLLDPLTMYMSDVCTIPSNLSGDPAISVPYGTGADGLPVGVQVLAPALEEERLFQVAAVLERIAPAREAR